MSTTPIADAILGLCRLDADLLKNEHGDVTDLLARWNAQKAKVESLMRQAAAQVAEDTAEAHDLAGPVPRSKVPACPHKEVLALWAEVLPELPQHTEWTDTRAKHLQARWRATAVLRKWQSKEDGLAYFRRLFGYIRKSAFLMGKTTTAGRRPFQLELAWLIGPENWAKIHEGKYHEEQ